MSMVCVLVTFAIVLTITIITVLANLLYQMIKDERDTRKLLKKLRKLEKLDQQRKNDDESIDSFIKQVLKERINEI